MKPVSKPTTSTILAAIQKAAKDQKTNPYQIAKCSGLPLTTVQRLLTIKINGPLRNVEMLGNALGLEIVVRSTGKSIVMPSTGRGHGKRKKKAA
jgi:hypothetical protein